MSVEVLRDIRLYGPLGRQFGRLHRLAVRSPAEAVQALCVVLPGFERAFMGGIDQRPAKYHVFVGAGDRRASIGIEDALEAVGTTEPIRFVPVIEGAKKGGLFQVLLGVALIGLTIWNPLGLFAGAFAPFAGAATIGKVLILGGIIQLLSPQRASASTPAEKTPSYGMDAGAFNAQGEGGPVPIAFGRVIIGSVEVSAGLSTDDIALTTAGAPLTPNPMPTVGAIGSPTAYMPVDPNDRSNLP